MIRLMIYDWRLLTHDMMMPVYLCDTRCTDERGTLCLLYLPDNNKSDSAKTMILQDKPMRR